MYKFKSITAILIVLAILLTGCRISFGSQSVVGSGDVIQEERSLDNVDRVLLTTMGDLTISLGTDEKLVIEAEDNLLPYIETRLRGGTLEISSQDMVNLQPTRPVRYFLTIKALKGLGISSSGNIQAPELNADRFTIDSSSSGEISLAGLVADRLDVELSSSGDVAIGGGSVPEQTISISSSGNYDAPDLASEQADVRLSSSGDATLRVSDFLRADLSSSGNVNYYGSPDVDQDTSSSGRVNKLGD